jgi:hypothetical protein
MKRLATVLSAVLLILSVSFAQAQFRDLDTWLDSNGDGLPDAGAQDATIGVPVTFDIWWDGKSYAQWTNWLYTFSLGPGPDSSSNYFGHDETEVDIVYWISGGTIFPENDFDSPYLFQIGGFNFADLSGVQRVATVSLTPIRTSLPGAACVVPIVVPSPPSYLYTFLGRTSTYGKFDQGQVNGTCYSIYQAPEACCFADGTCQDVRPDECAFIGGVPQGVGTTCKSSPCVATAIETRSWGRLKGLYR